MSIHKGKNGYGDPSNSHVDFTLIFFPYICVIGWHMENCAKHSPKDNCKNKKTPPSKQLSCNLWSVKSAKIKINNY